LPLRLNMYCSGSHSITSLDAMWTWVIALVTPPTLPPHKGLCGLQKHGAKGKTWNLTFSSTDYLPQVLRTPYLLAWRSCRNSQFSTQPKDNGAVIICFVTWLVNKTLLLCNGGRGGLAGEYVRSRTYAVLSRVRDSNCRYQYSDNRGKLQPREGLNQIVDCQNKR
jgi:hypothetical protein